MLIAGDLNLDTVQAHAARLREHVVEGRSCELDLSGVRQVDTAGLQVLVSASRHARALGRTFSITAWSPAAAFAVDLFRIAAEIEGDGAASSGGGDACADAGARGTEGTRTAVAHEGEDAFRRSPVDWHLSVRFAPEALRRGRDPCSLLLELDRYVTVSGMVTVLDALPGLPELDPQRCYVGLEIAFRLRPSVSAAMAERLLADRRETTLLELLPPHARLVEYARLVHRLPEGARRAGQFMLETGTLLPDELQSCLASVAPGPGHEAQDSGSPGVRAP